MFGLLCVISTLSTVKKLIDEKTEPVAPRGRVFDWDAYYKDIENGISMTESNKKIARGDYMVAK